MDDATGDESSNFFNLAWNREQNGPPSIKFYARYAPQLQQGEAEDNSLNYFSGQLGDLLCNQAARQAGYQSNLFQCHDKSGQNLQAANIFLLDERSAVVQLEYVFYVLSQVTLMQDIPSYHPSGVFDFSSLEFMS